MVEVTLAPQAEQDLLEIWLYIADDQPIHADRFLDRLETAAQRLATFAEIGTDRPELGEGVRSFPVERYMLYYRTRSDSIEVVRVLDDKGSIMNIGNDVRDRHLRDLGEWLDEELSPEPMRPTLKAL